jgi:hypothetical protein
MSQTATKPAPVKKALKLETLREKQQKLAAQIAEIESAQKAQSRKDETREKVIVGAAILANIKLHPETRAGVVEILEKAITAQRDREFLTARGWL